MPGQHQVAQLVTHIWVFFGPEYHFEGGVHIIAQIETRYSGDEWPDGESRQRNGRSVRLSNYWLWIQASGLFYDGSRRGAQATGAEMVGLRKEIQIEGSKHNFFLQ